mgnify:CR=1 FL=1
MSNCSCCLSACSRCADERWPTCHPRSLHLYACTGEEPAQAAATLQGLPRLTGAVLAIHAHWGTEEDEAEGGADYPDTDGYDHWVRPPPLAALTALTSLEIVGCASLPPDWHQLRQLKQLAVDVDWESEHSLGPPLAGADSLSLLCSLTRLELASSMPGRWWGGGGGWMVAPRRCTAAQEACPAARR